MFFFRRKHPISHDELSAYVDGALPDRARERLEAHVESCAACRETLAELRAVRQAVREMPRETAPRSFALREADVESAPAPAGGAFAGAPSLLGALATISIVAFVTLVAVDATGDRASDESEADVTRGLDAFDEQAAGDAVEEPEPLELGGALSGEDAEADGDGEAAPEATAGANQSYETLDGGDGEDAEAPDAPADAAERGAADGTPSEPATATTQAGEDGGPSRLRLAEAAAAAVALVTGGSFAFVWWRRRRA